MDHKTARILAGFIEEMSKDGVGWIEGVIGSEAYQLFRAIENPEDIPQGDKK